MSAHQDRNAEIERLYIAGMSYGRIARELRISPGTVAGVCWRLGLTPDERADEHQTEFPSRDARLAKVRLRNLRHHIATVEARLVALRETESALVQIAEPAGRERAAAGIVRHMLQACPEVQQSGEAR